VLKWSERQLSKLMNQFANEWRKMNEKNTFRVQTNDIKYSYKSNQTVGLASRAVLSE